jgi:hypothetical protein
LIACHWRLLHADWLVIFKGSAKLAELLTFNSSCV